MRFTKLIFVFSFLIIVAVYNSGCNYITHNTVSTDASYDSTGGEREPNYNISLDHKYQDFTSYFYMGNRIENFTAYFNTFYRSQEDFNEGYEEYRTSLISFYNKRLDSLGISPPISGSVKAKLDKAIERSSKIIQFHKNSKYIDDAVLIIGKSYYFEEEYYKAERTFNEFLSKFSSSVLADEAILFLGQTKVRLGKKEEGEKIFNNLVRNSDNKEIQSQAARDLGIMAYNKGSFEDAVNYFKSSIDFSNSNEQKAEGQFILAKILSEYKPELSAKEYKKVLDYTSDFDLLFFSRLNYAKGLIINKDFSIASEELEDIRKKYREEPAFTQLVDLEIANNFYAQGKYSEALNKYYEVIVKYPGTPSAADAYYYLARHEEEMNNDYLNAFVNYKKSVEESSYSDFYKESTEKSATYEKYFGLQDEVRDSGKVDIPAANAEVEKFRRNYNIEKGVEELNEQNRNSGFENNQTGPPRDGSQTGDGKGKPGGHKNIYTVIKKDSLENQTPEEIQTPEENQPPEPIPVPFENQGDPSPGLNDKEKEIEKSSSEDSLKNSGDDESTKKESGEPEKTINEDSLKAAEETLRLKEKDEKIFNAYYELAELFMYNINQNDSAEYYLKLLLTKFPEPERQAKLLYTLGNFYKNNDRKADADETFGKIITAYPGTIYAVESRKILGLKTDNDSLVQNPVDAIFTKAFNLFNSNKFPEAITELHEIELRYPQDSMLAKSLYSIGWIYENKLVNKDSTLFYYKKLSEKFPESEYTMKVLPMLQYIASLEVENKNDSSKVNPETGDSVKTEGKENPEGVTSESGIEEKKPEEKTETTSDEEKTKLSQEEINKLLKETESQNPPGK
ncbi:MAG: tetratricopeptide repeat protein [Ignavibacteria bacterium]|nr:tetratricopeptide repeat protein [Ignavibacteria bacterium]